MVRRRQWLENKHQAGCGTQVRLGAREILAPQGLPSCIRIYHYSKHRLGYRVRACQLALNATTALHTASGLLPNLFSYDSRCVEGWQDRFKSLGVQGCASYSIDTNRFVITIYKWLSSTSALNHHCDYNPFRQQCRQVQRRCCRSPSTVPTNRKHKQGNSFAADGPPSTGRSKSQVQIRSYFYLAPFPLPKPASRQDKSERFEPAILDAR